MASAPDNRRVWLSRRAIGLHVTLVIVVPLFLAFFWWQVQRVRQGNTLSWAYVFEWPFFTGYAIWLWWKLIHEQPIGHPAAADRSTADHTGAGGNVAEGSTATLTPAIPVPGAMPGSVAAVTTEPTPAPSPAPRPAVPASAQDEEDEELAAYNRYLAELNATGRPKRW